MDFLVDTNVLVYALDGSQPDRQAGARSWLTHLIEHDAAALSTQALSELANVCLNRLSPRWPPQRVSEHLGQLARSMTVLPLTPNVVIEALRGVHQHEMSFYDAQMWAVAHLYQVPYLLTEDMDSVATLGGVMIVDPFTVAPSG